MTISTDQLFAGAVQIAAIGAAWAHMAAAVKTNRQRTDERHAENQLMLREIRDDVKRINGTVTRHDERIKDLERD